MYKKRVPGARWVEVGACTPSARSACRGSLCGLCAAWGSCMAAAEPCCISDQLCGSRRDLLRWQRPGLLSKGCVLFRIVWCGESFGKLKFSICAVVTGGCKTNSLLSVLILGSWLGSDLATQGGCLGVDSLFSASCSNLYADTEAPESSDSLCRSMCSLFVDAAVPVGWGRAC